MESLTCEAGGWAEQGIFALLKHFTGSNIVSCLLLYLQFLLAMMACDARGGTLWTRMKGKFPILSWERTFSRAFRTAIPTFSCSEASGETTGVIARPAFAGDQPSKSYRFSGAVGDGLSPAIFSAAKAPHGNQELPLPRRRFLRAPWLHLSALSQSVLRCFSNLSGARGFNHVHPNQLVKGDLPSAKNKQVSISTSHQGNAFVQRKNIGQILFACCTCFNFIGRANAQDETGKPEDPKVWDTSGYAKVVMVTILVGLIGVVWAIYKCQPTFSEEDITTGLNDGPAVPRRSDPRDLSTEGDHQSLMLKTYSNNHTLVLEWHFGCETQAVRMHPNYQNRCD